MDELLILETPSTTIEQAAGYRVPGYLIVRPRDRCTRLGQLATDARADLFACIGRAEELLEALLAPERVYLMKFAELDPQVHFHVVPRSAALEAAYLAEVDDQRPCNGARLVEWLWRRHASLGHTDAELAAFVRAARDALG